MRFSKGIIKLKFKNLNTHSTALIYKLVFFIFLIEGYYSSNIYAQEIIDKIDVVQEFNSLDKDMKSALTNQVDVLSPRNFKAANTYLEKVKKSLDKQSALKKEIHEQITKARDSLSYANIAARAAKQNIDDVVTTRQLAVTAGAAIYFPYEFQKSDELLKKITSELESNNTQNVDKNRVSLQASYSDLELRAIKQQYIGQARLTLAQALKDGAEKYAPEKLKAAVKTYKEAREYINQHPHDADQIEKRAFAANENAKQLLQTTHDVAVVKAPEESKESFEDQIRTQQSAVSRDQKTIRSLEVKIEVLESEKAINDKLEKFRSNFTTDEADVYKQGDTLIIRLRGLKFPTSQAALNDSNLRLLGKVQRVVKDLGNREVVVEGHTDSLGSDAINEKLSKKRAQTIKDYFISIGVVPANKIKVIGRGEQAPLVTNDTPEGRAQNRRADIIIKL